MSAEAMKAGPERINRWADISQCGQYRYVLGRSWEPWEPFKTVTFVMLNPSTADAEKDDPTIRRCIAFAKAWGYCDLRVVNLFALRATDPQELRRHPLPVGNPQNDIYISNHTFGHLTVAAWGAVPWAEARIRQVVSIIGHPMCLGRTKAGSPRHPLYVSKDVQLEDFTMEAVA